MQGDLRVADQGGVGRGHSGGLAGGGKEIRNQTVRACLKKAGSWVSP